MKDRKEILKAMQCEGPLNELGNHLLTPALQKLAAAGVRGGHLMDQVAKDPERYKRMARALIYAGWPMTPSEIEAFEILGVEKFTVAEMSAQALGIQLPTLEEKVVPYSRGLLAQCALQNSRPEREADWRLVFVNDLRPRQFLDLDQGRNLFASAQVRGEMVIGPRVAFAAWDKEFKPAGRGYRLINFRSQFAMKGVRNLKWAEQLAEVVSLPHCEVTPAHWVLEAWLAHHLLTGREYFWGGSDGPWFSDSHHCVLGGADGSDSCVFLSYLANWEGDRCRHSDPASRPPEGPKQFLVQHFAFQEYVPGGVIVSFKVGRPS